MAVWEGRERKRVGVCVRERVDVTQPHKQPPLSLLVLSRSRSAVEFPLGAATSTPPRHSATACPQPIHTAPALRPTHMVAAAPPAPPPRLAHAPSLDAAGAASLVEHEWLAHVSFQGRDTEGGDRATGSASEEATTPTLRAASRVLETRKNNGYAPPRRRAVTLAPPVLPAPSPAAVDAAAMVSVVTPPPPHHAGRGAGPVACH